MFLIILTRNFSAKLVNNGNELETFILDKDEEIFFWMIKCFNIQYIFLQKFTVKMKNRENLS